MRQILVGSVCALLLTATSAVAQSALSFEKVTVAGTAGGLTATTYFTATGGQAQYCVGIIEDASIRYRTDGTVATAAIGVLGAQNSLLELVGLDNIRRFSAIRTASTSAVINFLCYPSIPETARMSASPLVAYSSGGFLASSGTAALPGYGFASDSSTDTGLYYIGANNIGVSAGGTLRWDWNTTRILSTIPVQFGTTTLFGIAGSGVKIGGTPPTIGSGFCTTPAIAGTDSAFRVTMGTGCAAASGVVTFGGTWTNAPYCVGGMETGTATEARVIHTVATTTQVTIYFADDNAGTFHGANPADASKVNVLCFGLQ